MHATVPDMERQVQVVPHDPGWKESFREEASRLRAIFEQEIIAIHHIGSTSIPNISAKPIIDILVEVRAIGRIDHFNSVMRQHGYRPRGENGLPGRRYFVKGSQALHTHHIHMYEHGHPDIARVLIFRDYLLAHPDEALRYGKLKEALAHQFPKDIDTYQSGKAELIQELEGKAARWKAEEAAC